MTADEAIKRLDDMQAQIIQGKPTFKEIADVIREAKELIGHIGWTSCERTDVCQRAEKWLG